MVSVRVPSISNMTRCMYCGLTTIRRKVVSPISALSREGLRVRGNHGFSFNGASNQHKPKLGDPSAAAHSRFCRRHVCHHSWRGLSFSVADHFGTHRAAIDTSEVLFH